MDVLVIVNRVNYSNGRHGMSVSVIVIVVRILWEITNHFLVILKPCSTGRSTSLAF